MINSAPKNQLSWLNLLTLNLLE